MASVKSFEDILESRRKEISNFLWVSRELSAKVPYKQVRKISPQELKLEVLNSPKIQILIEKECAKEYVSRDILLSKIKNILDEIGYNKKLQVIRWLALVLVKIFTQVCNGIHVNKHSITKLRNSMGNVPVMYVPSHRSYADFILMSYLCFHYDIDIPAIAAGMDFHEMWGMGNVLRNTGAFFMRRSYNDDDLYWQTFREYVYQLVTKGELGIEFFIEGTRSRSGKSLYPKLGLFSMILKAYFNGNVPDILFVPINISYERVMEEKLFAFELLGVPKPKESTSAFFKSLSLIKEKYGNIYVNFGEPISAYQYFGNKIDRSVHCLGPTYMQSTTEKEREFTSLLAQTIVKQQQKLGTITTSNLISIIIIDTLVYKKETLTVEKLIKEMTWLKMIMERFGAIINFTGTSESILEILLVHRNLIKINDSGEIGLIQMTPEVCQKIDKRKLKGHELHDEIMVKSVPFIMVQLYVNPTLHYFINSSLITAVLRKSNCDGITKDVLFTEYSFLRTLFSKEFALFSIYKQMEFEESLRHLEEMDVVTTFNLIRIKSNEKLQDLLLNLFQPFFITYYVLSSILFDVNVKDCSESHIIRTAQAEIENFLNVQESIHPYTLSLDTISNCLQSFTDLNIVQKLKRNGSIIYVIQRDAFPTIIEKLDDYVMYLIPELKIRAKAKL